MIDCTRVICITFMMFTHLKNYEGSSVYGGNLNIIGVLTNDYLGRASVPALSFVSGYLLGMGLKRNTSATMVGFAQRKAKSVLLPMLVWNLIYIGSVIAAYYAFNHSHRVISALQEGDAIDIINAFTALTDTPANFSLYFLRDLFITQLILFAIIQWTGAARIALLMAVAGYSVVGKYDPLVSREMIVLFSTCGALLGLSGGKLAALFSFRFIQALTLLLLAGFVLLGAKGVEAASSPQFTEILLRVAMSSTILIVAYFLAWMPISYAFHALAPIAFLTYLLHLPLTSFLWVLWSKLISSSNEGIAYAAYYIGAPLVAWLASISLASFLRGRPRAAGMLGVKG